MTGDSRYCAGCGQHVPVAEVDSAAHPVDSGNGPVACGEVVATRARAVEMIEAGLTQARQGLAALAAFAPAPPTGTAPTDVQPQDVWLTPEGIRRRVESIDAACGGAEFATFSPGNRQAGTEWVLRKCTLVERPEGTPHPAYTKDGDQ